MSEKKTALVISAHAADFVWRCGGAIALHQKRGFDVTVACLSYGERGESARLWKEGKTLDEVKSNRRTEAENAAKALNVHDIQFFDIGDYPLQLEKEDKFKLVDLMRAVQPSFMLSHSQYDPYNTDHMYTTQVAMEARMIAQAWGHNPGEKSTRCTSALLVRTTPNRTNGLETRHVFRHQRCLGSKTHSHRMHGRPTSPVGLLYKRCRESRQSLQT